VGAGSDALGASAGSLGASIGSLGVEDFSFDFFAFDPGIFLEIAFDSTGRQVGTASPGIPPSVAPSVAPANGFVQGIRGAGKAVFDSVKLFDNAEIASNFSNLRDSGFGPVRAGVTAFAASVGERIFGGLTDAFSGRNAAGKRLSAGQRALAGVTGTIDTVGTATGLKAAGAGIKTVVKAGVGVAAGLFSRNAPRRTVAEMGEEIANLLEANDLQSRINEKGYRNRPLTESQKESNREKSKIRSRVGHIFGVQSQRAGILERLTFACSVSIMGEPACSIFGGNGI